MGEKHPEAGPHVVSADRHDEAVVYLEGHGDVHPNVDLVALRRKIDRRLLPYMFCCYVLQFLDKVMLNVSVVHLLQSLPNGIVKIQRIVFDRGPLPIFIL